jgi:hypothetical protein
VEWGCVNPREVTESRVKDLSESIIIVLLTAHLLLVNLASGGPVVCIWLRRNRNQDSADRLGLSLAWWSVVALGVGMIAGGVILLFPASEPLWEALRRFPQRAYWIAGLELLFSLVCLLIYAAGWRWFGRHGWLHALVALLSATNLVYHFPPLMTVLGKMAANPAWTNESVIDRKVLLQLIARENAVSLSFHFALASLAVAGVTVLWLLARQGEQALEDAAAKRVARVSAAVAFGSTVLQFPVGLWVLTTISQTSRGALMGTKPLASLLFLAGVVLAMLLMARLLASVAGEVRQSEIHRTLGLLLLTTLLMTATLRLSRAQGIEQHSQSESLTYVAASSTCLGLGSSDGLSSALGSFFRSSSDPPGNLLALINSP